MSAVRFAIAPNEQGIEEVRLANTVIVNGNHKVRVSHCSTGAVIARARNSGSAANCSPGELSTN